MSSSKTLEDRSFYREIYEEGEGPWSNLTELDRRTAQWLEDVRGEVSSPARMVDLGTGRGRIVELFASHGYQAIGLDYLRDPVREARKRVDAGECSYVLADAFEPPLEEGSVDFLVDYGLLHHVRKAEGNAYRRNGLGLLSGGGYYFVSVFHESDGHAGERSRDWVHHRGHYDRFFTRDRLDAFLGEDFERCDAGFVEDGEHTFLHALYRRVECP